MQTPASFEKYPAEKRSSRVILAKAGMTILLRPCGFGEKRNILPADITDKR